MQNLRSNHVCITRTLRDFTLFCFSDPVEQLSRLLIRDSVVEFDKQISAMIGPTGQLSKRENAEIDKCPGRDEE